MVHAGSDVAGELVDVVGVGGLVGEAFLTSMTVAPVAMSIRRRVPSPICSSSRGVSRLKSPEVSSSLMSDWISASVRPVVSEEARRVIREEGEVMSFPLEGDSCCW